MKKLVYSKESISNLKKIYDHTKKNFSKNKAENVINDLLLKVSFLSKHPYLGKISDISNFMRELIVDGNVVYYQITEETIDIVFIKPRNSTL